MEQCRCLLQPTINCDHKPLEPRCPNEKGSSIMIAAVRFVQMQVGHSLEPLCRGSQRFGVFFETPQKWGGGLHLHGTPLQFGEFSDPTEKPNLPAGKDKGKCTGCTNIQCHSQCMRRKLFAKKASFPSLVANSNNSNISNGPIRL